MSTLIEVAHDGEWEKLSADIPASTLQVIYFKAEWALPVCSLIDALHIADIQPLLYASAKNNADLSCSANK